MEPESEAPASFEFGPFRMVPRRREIFAEGQPLELGGRAFDVLVALVEANGAVVGKGELMTRVLFAQSLAAAISSRAISVPAARSPAGLPGRKVRIRSRLGPTCRRPLRI